MSCEFKIPASMPADEITLKQFFGKQLDPWTGADFAAVTERDLVITDAKKIHGC